MFQYSVSACRSNLKNESPVESSTAVTGAVKISVLTQYKASRWAASLGYRRGKCFQNSEHYSIRRNLKDAGIKICHPIKVRIQSLYEAAFRISTIGSSQQMPNHFEHACSGDFKYGSHIICSTLFRHTIQVSIWSLDQRSL